MNVFNEWTCIFPGKMGLSWKRAWNGVGTKEQAEEIALRSCNTVAVPLQLFETMKEHERRMVVAERALNSPANRAEIERLQEMLASRNEVIDKCFKAIPGAVHNKAIWEQIESLSAEIERLQEMLALYYTIKWPVGEGPKQNPAEFAQEAREGKSD